MGKIGWKSIRKRSRGTIFPKRRKGYESELALNFGFSQIAASLISYFHLGKRQRCSGPKTAIFEKYTFIKGWLDYNGPALSESILGISVAKGRVSIVRALIGPRVANFHILRN